MNHARAKDGGPTRATAQRSRGVGPGGLAVLLAVALLVPSGAACGAATRVLRLPPPLGDPGLDVGDQIAVRVVGLPELTTQLRVDGDSTVEAPYVGRLRVAGLDARGFARVLAARLEAQGVVREARVEVAVTRSDLRGIAMLGQVVRPCRVPLAPGMTVTRALASAGGFLDPADHTVRLTRRTRTGVQTFAIPVDEIAAGRLLDVPLGPRDAIFVREQAGASSSL